ncbi:MAG: hypothetical protein LBD44_05675, partial [Spirochaetaceae bacterium]|nr:hypothetical protein [Spirochaetaceae bacterium]
MKTKNLVWPVLAMVLAGVIGGCQLSGGEEELPQDGGSDNKKPTRPTNDSGVTVYPDAIMLGKGSMQLFTASSDGVEDFTWSVSGGVDGTTISLEGVLTVSVDETAARLTVMANPGGTGKYGEAYVYILDNEAGPTVEGIAVSPRTVILAPSDSQTFQAVLLQDDPENGGAAEPNIEWSVDDRDDYFVENGKLVVAGNEEAETLTVRASQDSLYGTAIVTVLGNEEEPIPVNNGIRLDPQRVTVLK